MDKSVSVIFIPKPERWGLRGDPYLWDELEMVFETIPLPCTRTCFIDHFEKFFHELTSHSFKGNKKDEIHVERYAHGGMSSGDISMEFWQRDALPLLLDRLEKANV